MLVKIMNRIQLQSIFAFILLILSMSICFYIAVIGRETENILLMNSAEAFSQENIEWVESVNSIEFTYENIQRMNVHFSNKTANSYVSATNPSFAFIQNLNIIEGRFFNREEYKNSSFVCVLDKELAWQLFGDAVINGQKVEVGGYLFDVIGIYDTGNFIFQKSELPYMYIPYYTADEIFEQNKINNLILYASQNEVSLSEVGGTITSGIQKISEDILYFNISMYANSLMLKFLFILLLIALISIVCFLKEIIDAFICIKTEMSQLLRQHYFLAALKFCGRKIMKKSINILAYSACIFILIIKNGQLAYESFSDSLKINSIFELGFGQGRFSNIIYETSILPQIAQLHVFSNIFMGISLGSIILLYWNKSKV